MQIRLDINADLLFVEKPYGVATHSPGRDEEEGLVEYLSRKLKRNLWVVHRLDKGTSGIQVFAQSKEAAGELSALFEQGDVSKQYLLITKNRCDLRSFEVSSHITKHGHTFISDKCSSSPNAKTRFEIEADLDGYFLWRAFPSSGKPHQIRLHAAQSNIPILGDTDHGKDSFPRLMLHAAELSFPWRSGIITKSSTPPLAFTLPLLLQNTRLLAWISEVEWRERFFELSSQGECLRLIQDRDLGLRYDRLGEVLWVSDYTNSLANNCPTDKNNDNSSQIGDLRQTIFQENCINPKDLLLQLSSSRNTLSNYLSSAYSTNSDIPRLLPSSSFHLVSMKDRGDSENLTPENISSAPKTWVVEEGAARFLLKSDHGFSSGIFVDQRANRDWIVQNSAGKTVLNLFSYAGAFSVAAAVGGAASTLSVDTSNQAHNWAKENFALNNISLETHKFISDDVRKILAKFYRNQRFFDLIICDPPSFARSKGSIFSLDKELEGLIESCFSILNPGGHLIFSTNLEKVTNGDFKRRITRLSTTLFRSPPREEALEFIYPDWDAGLPREEGRLKTVRISK